MSEEGREKVGARSRGEGVQLSIVVSSALRGSIHSACAVGGSPLRRAPTGGWGMGMGLQGAVGHMLRMQGHVYCYAKGRVGA